MTIQWRFSTHGAGTLNPDTNPTPYTDITSEGATELSAQCEIIKLRRKSVRPWFGEDLLDTTSETHSIKEKTHSLDFIKIRKTFALSKTLFRG